MIPLIKFSLMSETWNNKNLFRLLWPLLIEQIFTVTMGTVDIAIVSGVGEYAVSGVNIVNNINNLFIIAFNALSVGGSVVVSQYIGRKDYEKSSLAARQLMYSVIIVSMVIMVGILFFREPIISLIYGSIADDVMEAALIYFFITILSYPMLGLYNASAALFRSTGNTRVPMLIVLLMNAIHIGCNCFFVLYLKIGVVGAGLATLTARTAAAFILLCMLITKRQGPVILAGLLKVRIVPYIIRSILDVGIPSALESSMFSAGSLLTQRIFTIYGTPVMAANAIAMSVANIVFMPCVAFGAGLITVVGQCVGARDYEGAKRHAAKIIKISYVIIFAVCVPVNIFLSQIFFIFNLNPEAHNMAMAFVRIHCITLTTVCPLGFALPSALRAAGDAKYVMIIAAASMWIVRVSLAYVLCYILKVGPLGVWFAMGVDNICRGIIFMVRWIGGKWKEKKVIRESKIVNI
jgi:putative MATE family efflux protein